MKVLCIIILYSLFGKNSPFIHHSQKNNNNKKTLSLYHHKKIWHSFFVVYIKNSKDKKISTCPKAIYIKMCIDDIE